MNNTTEGPSLGDSFDASQFVTLLLKSGELEEQLTRLKGLKCKAFFIVPGRDLGWMVDGGTLSKNFNKVCYIFVGVDERKHRQVLSLEGIPGIIDPRHINLVSEGTHLVLYPNKILSEPPDSLMLKEEFSKLEEGDKKEFIINASFSMDSDGLDAQVCVMEMDRFPCPLFPSSGEASTPIDPTPSVESLSAIPKENNPWRDTLLVKLRDPFAAPIVKEIKRLLKYLAQDNVSFNEKSQTVQRFYEDLQSLLVQNPVWEGVSREELDGSLEAVEKYIFSKSYNFVYQPTDSDDAVQDRLFSEKANMLSRLITFRALCNGGGGEGGKEGQGQGQGQGEKEESLEEPPIDNSSPFIEALSTLYQIESPVEKLSTLMLFVKGIAGDINNSVVGADLLVPSLIWIILNNIPSALISDVRYIQRFRNHSRLTGEASYCLTNIIAVITAIEKLYAEQVSKSTPIYTMLASQENLLSSSSTPIATPVTRTTSLDIASSVFNTIGFVPRAIGSAVVDTFRSRSSRSSKELSTGPFNSQMTTRTIPKIDPVTLNSGTAASTSAAPCTAGTIVNSKNLPLSTLTLTSTSTSLLPDSEVLRLRSLIMASSFDNLDEFSLRDVHLMLKDYRWLVSRLEEDQCK